MDSIFDDLLYSFDSLEKLIANLIINATNVIMPVINPKYPINVAILSNFSSNGVWLFSWALSIVRRIIPFCE